MQMPLREASTILIQKFNSLEKVGITTSSSCTTPPREIANKSPFNYKANLNDRDKEIEDLRNQIKLLKQKQKERDTQEQPKHTENKEEHPEPKKQPSGLRLRRPYSNQHRSVKGTEFRSRTNANTFKLQRTITNALGYKSDPSGNAVNLSKQWFCFDIHKLLNKNLIFIPTSKRQ